MQKRPLGNTELQLTPIGIGTWAIGGGDWSFGWGDQDEQEAQPESFATLALVGHLFFLTYEASQRDDRGCGQ